MPERAQAAPRDEIRDARASQDRTPQHPGEKRGIMSWRIVRHGSGPAPAVMSGAGRRLSETAVTQRGISFRFRVPISEAWQAVAPPTEVIGGKDIDRKGSRIRGVSATTCPG